MKSPVQKFLERKERRKLEHLIREASEKYEYTLAQEELNKLVYLHSQYLTKFKEEYRG